MNISGLKCPNCSSRIKAALENVDGVETADVSHTDGRAEISWTGGEPYPDRLIKAVEKIGYRAETVT
jgi:copper chaperone CopZ